MAFHVGFLLESAEVMPVGPREDPPVHQRGIITRRVLAVFVELDGRAALAAAVAARQVALDHRLRRELVAAKPADILWFQIAVGHEGKSEN